MAEISQYESRCPRCNVSFPIDTKVCIHCGGRTGPSLIETGSSSTTFTMREANAPIEVGESTMRWPEATGEEQVEEEMERPSWVRVLGSLFWVIVAVAFTVVRACSEK